MIRALTLLVLLLGYPANAGDDTIRTLLCVTEGNLGANMVLMRDSGYRQAKVYEEIAEIYAIEEDKNRYRLMSNEVWRNSNITPNNAFAYFLRKCFVEHGG
jgi:hypothetical protein